MGFETPLALLGLVAVGVPIAIHLMRRRDLPTIVLPTIALLQRARAQSRRRFELRDLLLLILRVLLVAAAVAAVAAPYLTRVIQFGNGSPMAVSIVIDDSMSMTRTEGGTALLSSAVSRARDIVRSLGAGSEVSIVLAGTPARVLLRTTTDRRAADKALVTLPTTSARSTELAGATALATAEVATAHLARRALVVLTDAAEHSHIGNVRWPTEGVDVDVERFGGDAPTANRALVSVDAMADPTSPGTASVSVEVAGSNAKSETVELVIDGRVVSSATLPVMGGGARGELHAPLSPDTTVSAVVRLANHDALPADDERAVLLHAPRGITCLIVNGQPDRVARESELRFLLRALANQPTDQPDVRVRTVDPDALHSRDVADADVVWLMDVGTPSEALATTLTDYVRNGGGLVLALGPRTNIAAYRGRLAPLLPATLGEAAEENPPTTFTPSAAGATFVDGLVGTEVRRRVLLDEWSPDATALLDYGDGSPALLSRRIDAGTVVLFTTTLDDTWTNLPYRPGYVPLISRLLMRLSKHGYASDLPVPPGKAQRIAVPASAERVVVTTPDGRTHELAGDGPFSLTDQPGAYRVAVETTATPLRDAGELAFVVAPEPSESDLRPGPKDAIATAKNTDTGRTHVQEPAANWVFLALGTLAIAEALARTSLRRRGGRPHAPAPATTAS